MENQNWHYKLKQGKMNQICYEKNQKVVPLTEKRQNIHDVHKHSMYAHVYTI